MVFGSGSYLKSEIPGVGVWIVDTSLGQSLELWKAHKWLMAVSDSSNWYWLGVFQGQKELCWRRFNGAIDKYRTETELNGQYFDFDSVEKY